VSPARPIDTVPGEARPYQGLRAGIVTRVVANVVDFLVVVAILGAIYVGWAAVLFLRRGEAFTLPTPSFALAYVVGSVVLALYFVAAWSTTGRTYGDQLLGLRVVNRHGGRMRLVGAFVRSVGCVVFPIGLFWCAISRENRSIQDVVVRTSVIYDWEVGPRRGGVRSQQDG
jgi:uncharacterized RDD family membrane protein YckC